MCGKIFDDRESLYKGSGGAQKDRDMTAIGVEGLKVIRKSKGTHQSERLRVSSVEGPNIQTKYIRLY